MVGAAEILTTFPFKMPKGKNAENFSTKALAVNKCHLQIDDVHSLYDRQKLRPLSD